LNIFETGSQEKYSPTPTAIKFFLDFRVSRITNKV
jgi:hypothetical protein